MSQIYKNTYSYLLAKTYINWSFRKYYSEVLILGEENIPKDEAVIYAANHTNALMDALAILSLPPLKLPKVFLARADIFHLPKPIVKFIQWTKITPAYRIRDGYENLAKNQSSFELADEVLLNNAAMCIMPEGSQEIEHQIRPLVKGIFRIAFSAQQKLSAGKTIYILPIGLNYGDVVKQGKHLIINIGKPIPVIDYIEEYAKNPAIAINKIRQKLREDLEELSLHIASKEHYEIFNTTIEVSNHKVLNLMGLEENTHNLFKVRQHTAKVLDEAIETKPDRIESLRILSKRYKKIAQKINLPFAILEQSLPSFWKNTFNLLKLFLVGLLALPGMLLHLIPYTLVSQIPKWMKMKFEGFFSSVYYVGGIVLFPVFYLLQSVILSFAFGLHAIYILVFIVLHYFIGKATMHLYRSAKNLFRQIRYYYLFRNKKEKLAEIQEIRENILQIVECLLDR